MDIALKNVRVVAVDGGTATGKGRLIEELAALLRKKGVPVIHASTGSIYRAIAYAAIDEIASKIPNKLGLSKDEINRTTLDLLRQLSAVKLLELVAKRQIEMHGGVVWLDGAPADVSEQLKAPGVGTGASIVGGLLELRKVVNAITRKQINEFDGFALIDGRDIGHEVVPDAPLKLLLVVAPEVAAARSSEHTLEEIIARDSRDRSRTFGQLKHPDDPGEGVNVLATDNHSPESLRDEVYSLMKKVFTGL